MRTAPRLPVVVAAVTAGVALSGGPASPRRNPNPGACPPARYLLAEPLVVGQAAPVAGLAVGSTQIAIDGLCPPIAPKQWKAIRKGTRVKATWPSCPGLTGRVRFTGLVAGGCASFTGTLKARRVKQRVAGRRSTCGDGVVDRSGGEECDPPLEGACDPTCRTTVTAVIGPSGGQVTSRDGRLTLDVPTGALASDTTIAVRRLAPEELPAGAAALGLGLAYELGPDGLQFAVPVTATVQLDGPPFQEDGTFAADAGFLFTVSADGTVELPTGQRTVLDIGGNTATASGQLTHFTRLFYFGSDGTLRAGQGFADRTRLTNPAVDRRETFGAPFALTTVAVDPAEGPGVLRFAVGQKFLTRVSFVLTNKDLERESRVFHTDMTEGGEVEYLGATTDGGRLGVNACEPRGADPLDPDAKATLLGTVLQRTDPRIRPRLSDGSFAEGFFCYRCREVGVDGVKAKITIETPVIHRAPDFPLIDFPFIDEVYLSLTQEQLTTDIDILVECVAPTTTTTSVTVTSTTSMTSTSSTSSTTSTSRTTTSTTSTTSTTIVPCVLDGTRTPPVCGGLCEDPRDFCFALPGFAGGTDAECGCVTVDARCRDQDPGSDVVCGGFCGSPSARCGQFRPGNPDDPCVCIELPNPCGLDQTQAPPVCGGDCPPSQACTTSPLPGEACRCVVPGASTTTSSTTSSTTSTSSTTASSSTSTTTSSTTSTTLGGACGNGTVDPGETCDDGNAVPDDGCQDCRRPAQYTVRGISAVDEFFSSADLDPSGTDTVLTATIMSSTTGSSQAVLTIDAAGATTELIRSGDALPGDPSATYVGALSTPQFDRSGTPWVECLFERSGASGQCLCALGGSRVCWQTGDVIGDAVLGGTLTDIGSFAVNSVVVPMTIRNAGGIERPFLVLASAAAGGVLTPVVPPDLTDGTGTAIAVTRFEQPVVNGLHRGAALFSGTRGTDSVNGVVLFDTTGGSPPTTELVTGAVPPGLVQPVLRPTGIRLNDRLQRSVHLRLLTGSATDEVVRFIDPVAGGFRDLREGSPFPGPHASDNVGPNTSPPVLGADIEVFQCSTAADTATRCVCLRDSTGSLGAAGDVRFLLSLGDPLPGATDGSTVIRLEANAAINEQNDVLVPAVITGNPRAVLLFRADTQELLPLLLPGDRIGTLTVASVGLFPPAGPQDGRSRVFVDRRFVLIAATTDGRNAIVVGELPD